MKLISRSEADTRKISKKLASKLHGGSILALQGDLGAGKTTFVKGLAEGLKIKQTIRSPTFVLMKVFHIPENNLKAKIYKLKSLIHIDAYRLTNENDIAAIGVLDYLGKSDTVVVIEWPERVKKLLKKFGKKVIWINFDYGKKENERIIKISPASN